MDTVNNHLDCRAQFKYNSIFTTSTGCVICSAIFSLLYPDATCQPETHGATSRGSRVDHGGEYSPNTANQFFFSFLFWLLSTVHNSTVQPSWSNFGHCLFTSGLLLAQQHPRLSQPRALLGDLHGCSTQVATGRMHQR